MNVEAMLDEISVDEMRTWVAAYHLDASDSDPEPTKWDTKETAAEKLRRKALRGTT